MIWRALNPCVFDRVILMQVGDFGDEIQNLFKCSILSSFPDEFLFITELKRFSKFARKIMKTWYTFFGDGLAYP